MSLKTRHWPTGEEEEEEEDGAMCGAMVEAVRGVGSHHITRGISRRTNLCGFERSRSLRAGERSGRKWGREEMLLGK